MNKKGYYIVIRGPLASGKSTITRKLADKLGARVFSMDGILEKMGLDKIDEKENRIPLRNFIEAQNSILPEAKKTLENGKAVIFDGCFYHKEAIEHLLNALDYPHYVFTLKVSLETCIERERHREKRFYEIAVREVYKQVYAFEYGIPVDADADMDSSVNTILSEVSKLNKRSDTSMR